MTPSEFAAKWRKSTRTERAASQEHFIDLCRMLGQKTPNEADPHGDWYAFEKSAEKLGGSDGFADVWKRGHFAWEYKGKHKNLEKAYEQLLKYREALENPPLLVVCDLEQFEVHTNFTGTAKVVHRFTLEDLKSAPTEPLKILRALMCEPSVLRPTQTRAEITEEAAGEFAEIAGSLQKRGNAPEAVAHFLNRLLFCLFAEDAGLLPKDLLTRLIAGTVDDGSAFTAQLSQLFLIMSKKTGTRFFGTEEIEWFNGGLFDSNDVLVLNEWERAKLLAVAKLNWSNIEPAILGTLFERGLDPSKRSQLGAHYTDRESILRVVEPVVLAPLRREFEAMKTTVSKLVAKELPGTKHTGRATLSKRRFIEFLDRLSKVRVLDPACGSGNFLYIALQLLKDLEKEAIIWGAETFEGTAELPQVGPQCVRGIELNAYAAELARVSIWIGEIQWMLANGYGYHREPVLKPLESIEQRDAILERPAGGKPQRAEWPTAEFIVGNPPFLGGKKLRTELRDDYVDALFAAWKGHVPAEADLVCYWHEKAREMIATKRSKRTGMLATQGIRSGANREVLDRIAESGAIFMAWSDQPWVVEGAAVRISVVGQDDGSEKARTLDGAVVEAIHSDLTPGGKLAVDLTTAHRLDENSETSFMGDTKGGKFDIDEATARQMLAAPKNVNGQPNADVVVPWVNGLDITRRQRSMAIIDFGTSMTEQEAAKYELPFRFVTKNVKEKRLTNTRAAYREAWWRHAEARPKMRAAYARLSRFIVTPRNGRQRVFAWLSQPTLPDCQVIVIARDDDYAFGVLHSRVHETWALGMCSWLGIGNDPRYTPTTTFETFPFPWPLTTPSDRLTKKQKGHAMRIAEAAKALVEQRSRWLDPPECTTVAPPLAPGWPQRRVPKDAAAAKLLSQRTLTKLYNERPDWLKNLHLDLDRAVLEAYEWPFDITDQRLLANLLSLNQERPAAAKGVVESDVDEETAE